MENKEVIGKIREKISVAKWESQDDYRRASDFLDGVERNDALMSQVFELVDRMRDGGREASPSREGGLVDINSNYLSQNGETASVNADRTDGVSHGAAANDITVDGGDVSTEREVLRFYGNNNTVDTYDDINFLTDFIESSSPVFADIDESFVRDVLDYTQDHVIEIENGKVSLVSVHDGTRTEDIGVRGLFERAYSEAMREFSDDKKIYGPEADTISQHFVTASRLKVYVDAYRTQDMSEMFGELTCDPNPVLDDVNAFLEDTGYVPTKNDYIAMLESGSWQMPIGMTMDFALDFIPKDTLKEILSEPVTRDSLAAMAKKSIESESTSWENFGVNVYETSSFFRLFDAMGMREEADAFRTHILQKKFIELSMDPNPVLDDVNSFLEDTGYVPTKNDYIAMLESGAELSYLGDTLDFALDFIPKDRLKEIFSYPEFRNYLADVAKDRIERESFSWENFGVNIYEDSAFLRLFNEMGMREEADAFRTHILQKKFLELSTDLSPNLDKVNSFLEQSGYVPTKSDYIAMLESGAELSYLGDTLDFALDFIPKDRLKEIFSYPEFRNYLADVAMEHMDDDHLGHELLTRDYTYAAFYRLFKEMEMEREFDGFARDFMLNFIHSNPNCLDNEDALKDILFLNYANEEDFLRKHPDVSIEQFRNTDMFSYHCVKTESPIAPFDLKSLFDSVTAPEPDGSVRIADNLFVDFPNVEYKDSGGVLFLRDGDDNVVSEENPSFSLCKVITGGGADDVRYLIKVNDDRIFSLSREDAARLDFSIVPGSPSYYSKNLKFVIGDEDDISSASYSGGKMPVRGYFEGDNIDEFFRVLDSKYDSENDVMNFYCFIDGSGKVNGPITWENAGQGTHGYLDKQSDRIDPFYDRLIDGMKNAAVAAADGYANEHGFNDFGAVVRSFDESLDLDTFKKYVSVGTKLSSFDEEVFKDMQDDVRDRDRSSAYLDYPVKHLRVGDFDIEVFPTVEGVETNFYFPMAESIYGIDNTGVRYEHVGGVMSFDEFAGTDFKAFVDKMVEEVHDIAERYGVMEIAVRPVEEWGKGPRERQLRLLEGTLDTGKKLLDAMSLSSDFSEMNFDYGKERADAFFQYTSGHEFSVSAGRLVMDCVYANPLDVLYAVKNGCLVSSSVDSEFKEWLDSRISSAQNFFGMESFVDIESSDRSQLRKIVNSLEPSPVLEVASTILELMNYEPMVADFRFNEKAEGFFDLKENRYISSENILNYVYDEAVHRAKIDADIGCVGIVKYYQEFEGSKDRFMSSYEGRRFEHGSEDYDLQLLAYLINVSDTLPDGMRPLSMDEVESIHEACFGDDFMVRDGKIVSVHTRDGVDVITGNNFNEILSMSYQNCLNAAREAVAEEGRWSYFENHSHNVSQQATIEGVMRDCYNAGFSFDEILMLEPLSTIQQDAVMSGLTHLLPTIEKRVNADFSRLFAAEIIDVLVEAVENDKVIEKINFDLSERKFIDDDRTPWLAGDMFRIAAENCENYDKHSLLRDSYERLKESVVKSVISPVDCIPNVYPDVSVNGLLHAEIPVYLSDEFTHDSDGKLAFDRVAFLVHDCLGLLDSNFSSINKFFEELRKCEDSGIEIKDISFDLSLSSDDDPKNVGNSFLITLHTVDSSSSYSFNMKEDGLGKVLRDKAEEELDRLRLMSVLSEKLNPQMYSEWQKGGVSNDFSMDIGDAVFKLRQQADGSGVQFYLGGKDEKSSFNFLMDKYLMANSYSEFLLTCADNIAMRMENDVLFPGTAKVSNTQDTVRGDVDNIVGRFFSVVEERLPKGSERNVLDVVEAAGKVLSEMPAPQKQLMRSYFSSKNIRSAKDMADFLSERFGPSERQMNKKAKSPRARDDGYGRS